MKRSTNCLMFLLVLTLNDAIATDLQSLSQPEELRFTCAQLTGTIGQHLATLYKNPHLCHLYEEQLQVFIVKAPTLSNVLPTKWYKDAFYLKRLDLKTIEMAWIKLVFDNKYQVIQHYQPTTAYSTIKLYLGYAPGKIDAVDRLIDESASSISNIKVIN